VVDHPLDDELACERGNREVEAFDAQAGDADDRANEGRHRAAGRQRYPKGQVQVHGKVGRGIGADRHEGGVPDRNLARIADEDVEAQRPHDGDQDEIDDREIVLLQGQRQHHGEDQEHRCHRPPRDRQRIERHVGRVAGLEDAGLPMQHVVDPLAFTRVRSGAFRTARTA
jgi:hypothetical protein